MNFLLLLNIIISIWVEKTWCVGGKHYSNTNNITQYEELIRKKLVKNIKGTCTFCGRNKNQIFTK